MPGPQSKSNPGPRNNTPLVPSWMHDKMPAKHCAKGGCVLESEAGDHAQCKTCGSFFFMNQNGFWTRSAA